MRRLNFNSYRKYFSKEIQKTKRLFWKRKQTELENLESNNPKMFWKEIGKLDIGKDRRQFIPMEVMLPNGEVSTNEDVLHVWKNGFNSLLNPVTMVAVIISVLIAIFFVMTPCVLMTG